MREVQASMRRSKAPSWTSKGPTDVSLTGRYRDELWWWKISTRRTGRRRLWRR